MAQMIWFGHSCVGFRTEQTFCLCDPISDPDLLSEIPPLETPPKGIFVSHEHWDHFHPETISQVAAERTIIYGPKDVIDLLQTDNRLSHLCARAVEPGQMIDIGDVACEVFSASEGVAYVFTFKRDDIVVFFMGDSVLLEPMKSIEADIVFFPMWPFKDPKRGRELSDFLKSSISIPMHFHQEPSAKQNFFIDMAKFASLTDPIGTVRALSRGQDYDVWVSGAKVRLEPSVERKR